MWANVLAEIIDEPDFEWLMIDASHCKVHPHASGAVGGNQAMSRTKGGLNPKFTLLWMRMGMPIRFIITEGTVSDCTKAIELITDIDACELLADKAYDTNEIISFAAENGMTVTIPSKKNRKSKREHDEYTYQLRHLVENAFLKFKRFRGVATRYAKTVSAFTGSVTLAALVIWLRVLV